MSDPLKDAAIAAANAGYEFGVAFTATMAVPEDSPDRAEADARWKKAIERFFHEMTAYDRARKAAGLPPALEDGLKTDKRYIPLEEVYETIRGVSTAACLTDETADECLIEVHREGMKDEILQALAKRFEEG